MIVNPDLILPGHPHPPGATVDEDGVNFSLFSEHATSVELLLFAAPDAMEPLCVIPLDPIHHRTYRFWHVYVRGLSAGAIYAYRVTGPDDTARTGHRFNPRKVLTDPYARGIIRTHWRRSNARTPEDNLATSMRGVVIETEAYDWEGDHPLHRPLSETIIYELHVGGFTRSPSSGCAAPGTFSALVEKIPYLRALGITAVELLPIFEFDPSAIERANPLDGQPLYDFWGYNSLNFFCPHDGYCISPEEGAHISEFRDMVKALHRAGIEVILDFPINHTGEGNESGPVVNLKGLDNDVYYYLDPADRRHYTDYSGCGNTLNCNHPIVTKLILDCLEFWVREMHVDGFRFDEASILSRGEDGAPMATPPVLWQIELSETLADTKIIAEAWDAAGLYEIGYFPGYRWAEWNGRFRDEMRRFVRGEPGLIGAVAARLAGSADIYQAAGRLPVNSLNFVTCHDGFTLNDLVSYNQKHNEANGEGNRDGTGNDLSWNCGEEGESAAATVEALRQRQLRNFVALLLLARGVPMLLAGDEMRRSQQGNNNAYCQDNAISWLDWRLVERHHDVFRFFQQMIAFRLRHRALRRDQFFTGQATDRGLPDIEWHGRAPRQPRWEDPRSRCLACTIAGEGHDEDLHIMMNMEPSDIEFAVPPILDRSWWLAVDTSQPSPADIFAPGQEPPLHTPTFVVASHSIAVLISRPTVAAPK